MPDSNYIYESGKLVHVGTPQENNYVFSNQGKLSDGGDSDLVYISGSPLGQAGIILGPWEDESTGTNPPSGWSDGQPSWTGNKGGNHEIVGDSRTIYGDRTWLINDDGGGWTGASNSYNDENVLFHARLNSAGSVTDDGDPARGCIAGASGGSAVWDIHIGIDGNSTDDTVKVKFSTSGIGSNDEFYNADTIYTLNNIGNVYDIAIEDVSSNFRFLVDGDVVYEHGSGLGGSDTLWVYSDDIEWYVDYPE